MKTDTPQDQWLITTKKVMQWKNEKAYINTIKKFHIVSKSMTEYLRIWTFWRGLYVFRLPTERNRMMTTESIGTPYIPEARLQDTNAVHVE